MKVMSPASPSGAGVQRVQRQNSRQALATSHVLCSARVANPRRRDVELSRANAARG